MTELTARAVRQQRGWLVSGPPSTGASSYQTGDEQLLCLRVAFVTGDTLGAVAGGFLARAGRPILEKPFVPAELRRLMTELARNN
jgi:hypothetical protein